MHRHWARAVIVALIGLLLVGGSALGQGSQQVVIVLDGSVGRSVGVFSTRPSGWTADASTDTLVFGNYVGPVTGQTHQARTLLWFPLGAIPVGVQVVQASLEVYVYDWPFGLSGTVPMGAYQVRESWDEGLTWGGLPVHDSDPVATADVGASEGWVGWDVTSLVQAWVAGGGNDGVMLSAAPHADTMPNNPDPAYTGWAAAAYGRTSGRVGLTPRLVVTYQAAAPAPPGEIPEPTTLVLLGGGLVGVGWFVARERSRLKR